MTQKQKDLLLKDLCARLPYEIKVSYKGKIYQISIVSICNETITIYGEKGYPIEVQMKDCKPYLFPISKVVEEVVTTSNKHIAVNVDFFHKNHIDYRGLIPKGLAIDATGLNIY